MPFSVDPDRISDAEAAIGIKLPSAWRKALERKNGGEFEFRNEVWTIHPVADNADRRRTARTCNHIGWETAQARTWPGFPPDAVALAGSDLGNRLIAKHDSRSVWLWDHETCEVTDLADFDPLTASPH